MRENLQEYRREAKRLRRAFGLGEAGALARVEAVLGRVPERLIHAEALLVVAREAGHKSWPRLKLAAELAAMSWAQKLGRLRVAVFEGQAHVARRLLRDAPELGRADLGIAAALYDVEEVDEGLPAAVYLEFNRVDCRQWVVWVWGARLGAVDELSCVL